MSEGSYIGRIEPLKARPHLRARRAAAIVAAILAAGLAVLAIAWLAASAFARSDRTTSDLRLETEVRSASAAFAMEVATADGRAGSLASSPAMQRALVRGDREAARGLLGSRPGLLVFRGDRLWLGKAPPLAVTRSVTVAARGRRLGRVVGFVAVDRALTKRLADAIGLRHSDSFVLVRGVDALSSPLNRAFTVRRGGSELRAYAVPLLAKPVRVALQGMTRNSSGSRRGLWIALALLASLATIGIAGYGALGARRRRVQPVRPRTRRDLRQVLALVGDALASTHDPDKLVPIILHATMEATGASAGVVLRSGVEVAREGDVPPASAEGLRLELTPEGGDEVVMLFLYSAAGQFDEETVALAHSLAAQAAVALDNARLHGIVRRQAVTDELTGLANRRSFLETLEIELRRAERFGSSLALLVADLDDFKLVNDRFGHQAGDDVLRAFADVLRRRIREIDLAARLGGEEFAILLPETEASGAEALAEALRAAVAELLVPVGGPEVVRVTASFGVASFPETHGADELMTAADLALYGAKRQGKNRVVAGRPNGLEPGRPSEAG
jgi:diguanylate cyclase (GGDEF)-like protein